MPLGELDILMIVQIVNTAHLSLFPVLCVEILCCCLVISPHIDNQQCPHISKSRENNKGHSNALVKLCIPHV